MSVYTDTLTWLSAHEDFTEDFNQVNYIPVDLTEDAQLIYFIYSKFCFGGFHYFLYSLFLTSIFKINEF